MSKQSILNFSVKRTVKLSQEPCKVTDETSRTAVEKHIDRYSALDKTVRPLFTDYMENIMQLEDTQRLHEYVCPNGSLHANRVHVMHWPVRRPGLRPCHSITEDHISPSIAFNKRIFKTFDKGDLAFDLVPVLEDLYDPVTHERVEIHRLYRQKATYEEHLLFAERLIRNLNPLNGRGVIFLHGKHVERWFREVFGDVRNLQLNGATWTVIYLYHPEHLQRFATQATRQRYVELIRQLGEEYNLPYDDVQLSRYFKSTSGRPDGDDPTSELLDGEREQAEDSPILDFKSVVKHSVKRVRYMQTDQGQADRSKLTELWFDVVAPQSQRDPILLKEAKQNNADIRLKTWGPSSLIGDSYVLCFLCGERALSRAQMRTHFEDCHRERITDYTLSITFGETERVYVCPGISRTGKACAFKSIYFRHIERHFGPKHKNEQWNLDAVRTEDITRVQRDATLDARAYQIWPCYAPGCNNTQPNEAKLTMHMFNAHHGGHAQKHQTAKKDSPKIPWDLAAAEPYKYFFWTKYTVSTFECYFNGCDKTFDDFTSLHLHFLRHQKWKNERFDPERVKETPRAPITELQKPFLTHGQDLLKQTNQAGIEQQTTLPDPKKSHFKRKGSQKAEKEHVKSAKFIGTDDEEEPIVTFNRRLR